MEKGIEIFFCYARKDQALLNDLKTHLTLITRSGLINMWHDANISPGAEWEKEIDKHLNTAQIILLLVSPDFMASEYCYSKEMMRAMERHERGEARVIPILLRPVDWKGAPFGKLQVLPTDAQPITKWQNRDDAFLDIATEIKKVAEDLASASSPHSEEPPFSHDSQDNLGAQQTTGEKNNEFATVRNPLRAVVVGINQYSNPRYSKLAQLRFARTDAEETYNTLYRSNVFYAQEVSLLTEERATRRTISERIASVFTPRSFDSTTIELFYFAGHGLRSPLDLSVSLGCYDADFVDPTQGGIRLDDISNWLLRSSAACSIVIIDATFSGSIIDTIQSDKIPPSKTLAIFASCGSDQASRESRQLRHGIFTDKLLRGWRDGEARGYGGVITLLGLADYVTSSFASDWRQIPQIFIRGGRTIVLSK